jgi:hypothetical protein
MAGHDERDRAAARRVTYGFVAVLLVTAAVQLEAWPLTAFRLFSQIRTGTGSTLELVAVAPDGVETPVPARTQMLARLADATPEHATAMVDAWLRQAGLSPDDVTTVLLERAAWRLDPVTLARQEDEPAVVREVRP